MGSHCRLPAHMCTTHLPTCTTAPIWLRGDDRQMTAEFFAVRLVSNTERARRKVFDPTLKTLLAFLQSSLTPDTPETIMLTSSVQTKHTDQEQHPSLLVILSLIPVTASHARLAYVFDNYSAHKPVLFPSKNGVLFKVGGTFYAARSKLRCRCTGLK